MVNTLVLVQSLIVSRHGVRSPYPPNYGTVTDFSAYTNKIFPDNNTWGMSYDAFANQHLTPHGQKIIPYMGGYYAERFERDGMVFDDCSGVVCFADDNARDILTAELWLQGLGCSDTTVNVVNSTSYPEMQPILQDEYNVGCPPATEDMVNGLYGGHVDTYTNMYASEIQTVMDVLDMPADAEICSLTNEDFNPTGSCSMFDTGYIWTGRVYDGTFKAPVYYSRYFAEHWMLQYLSNISDWAFGMLTTRQLNDIYALQVANFWFGTNYWNAISYGSHHLAYVVASMEQLVTGNQLAGCPQDTDTPIILLFSHDANILYLQRLLNLNWIPESFRQNVAVPGGLLAFDLFVQLPDGPGTASSSDSSDSLTASSQYYVKVHYDVATSFQQRNADVLSADINPPSVSEIVIPECGELYCPWVKFRELLLSRLCVECVEEPLRSSVQAMMVEAQGNEGGDDNSDGSSREWGYRAVISLTAAGIVGVLGAIAIAVVMVRRKRVRCGHGDFSEKDKLLWNVEDETRDTELRV